MFLDASDVQHTLAQYLRNQREARGLSRAALAKVSLVPAATIKKFELTGQISFRQFVLLWQCLDDLTNLVDLARKKEALPASIDEVLRGDF